MVETETYTIHLTAFIYQPVAAPHQSFLSTGSEVPFDKKSSFPPGGSRAVQTFSLYALVGVANWATRQPPVSTMYQVGRVRALTVGAQ